MRSRDALLAALATCLGLACSGAPLAEQPAQTPPARSLVRLSEVASLGPYLDATLSNQEFSLRFFFPQSADCRTLIRSGAELRYVRIGSFGRLVDDEKRRCEPAGVGSLREWRDSQPRRRSQYLVPRVQAVFHTVFTGEDLVLIRGRFPLALEIRWPAAMDSVAMIPARPVCDALRARGKATLEFHASGPEPFLLVAEPGSCPILGFAIPLEVE